MDVMLVSLTSAHLPRFFIISSAHGAFSFSTNGHEQDIGTQKCLLRNSSESFDTRIVKKLKFQYGAKKLSCKRNQYLFSLNIEILLFLDS